MDTVAETIRHEVMSSGRVTFYLRGPEDVPGAVELFRLKYHRITTRSGHPHTVSGATELGE